MLGNLKPFASLPGEIVVTHNEWYDFEAKYDEGEMDLVVPARITDEQIERAQELAVRAFVATDCEGMARADMFVRDDGEVLVNELNTIPGSPRRASTRGCSKRRASRTRSCCSGWPTSRSSASSAARTCASKGVRHLRCLTPCRPRRPRIRRTPIPTRSRRPASTTRSTRGSRTPTSRTQRALRSFAPPRRAPPLPADRHRAGRGDLERRRAHRVPRRLRRLPAREARHASCSATAGSKRRTSPARRSPTSCSNDATFAAPRSRAAASSGVELSGCTLAELVGVESLRGARMPWGDILENAPLFAQGLGIQVISDE